jgi:glycosyltransferase involved in cell wall biosynthesis
LTTVSRYMKFRMWEAGQNPLVIPNGIPRESIVEPDPHVAAHLRSAAGTEHFWFKIGRFDPDKRWLMAVAAAALLKRREKSVKLLMRGGREPHGAEVLSNAHYQGLVVRDARAPADVASLASLLRESQGADVINVTSFVSDQVVKAIYGACDAVLANSGHEPFGLVGLEVMAAGGLAVTGSTGEDYAEPFRNAIVLETDDPVEIVSELTALKERPRLVAALRRRGKTTTRDYVWEKVIADQLLARIEFAAQRQAVKLPDGQVLPKPRRVVKKPSTDALRSWRTNE